MAVKDWPHVSLNDLLTQVGDMIEIENDVVYKQVTVRLHNKGLVLRHEAVGREIKTKKQYRIGTGQFLYSRIDARNGAMGLVTPELNGAIVSNDFPVFEIHTGRLDPAFFRYCAATSSFREECARWSAGTTNRRRLKETGFLKITIPLPTLNEQQRIVARIEALTSRARTIAQFEEGTQSSLRELLLDAYFKITQDAPHLSMLEVAPLIRRPVEIEDDAEYPELGIRSFGKGTFHKPAIRGDELNGKRIYRIEAGDLLFSNVFSWEGAVAVARSEDHGRYGSHRFITRLPKPGVATAQFLCFHFSTEEGLQQLRDASPGAAGRNRTLGLKALDNLTVPVPPYEKQLWFDEIQNRVTAVRQLQAEKVKLLEALLPSVLDKAFKGEL